MGIIGDGNVDRSVYLKGSKGDIEIWWSCYRQEYTVIKMTGNKEQILKKADKWSDVETYIS